jgi:hypothetical protein
MDLHQGIYWEDEGGDKIRISSMLPHHADNCARWLIRYAKQIEFRDSMQFLAMLAGPFAPSGDAACDALDSAIAQEQLGREDPVAWIQSLPLWKALEERGRAEVEITVKNFFG